ncbi:hypothetical protein BBJ28_00019991 [Nothophytophthora sp. Chile5]|nr:hypothetical protein BBJ28_00019991 [Nothophytophthora sp. Chile5]
MTKQDPSRIPPELFVPEERDGNQEDAQAQEPRGRSKTQLQLELQPLAAARRRTALEALLDLELDLVLPATTAPSLKSNQFGACAARDDVGAAIGSVSLELLVRLADQADTHGGIYSLLLKNKPVDQEPVLVGANHCPDLMEDAAAIEKPEQLALRERNAELEGQLDLLRGVLALVKEDLHVKNDQIDHLYDTGAVDLESRGNSTQVQELPAVLVTNVLSYLDCSSVIRAAQTHRNWYVVVMQHAFWADHYLQRWQATDERQPWTCVHMFASKYTTAPGLLPQESHDKCELKTPDESQVDWKELYRERHEVERNWTSGKSIITTLNGHYGTVTCLQFNEDRMLWDAESGQKLTQFVGHPQVNTIKACGERIISGGSDHAVKVWDRRQGTCASTLTGHKGAVMSVDYNHDNHVISGSYDATIKVRY